MKTINTLKEYKIGEHLFALAMTRAGKSYLINTLIKKLLNSYIIFDCKCDNDYTSLGAYKVESYAELHKALSEGKKKILFESEKLTPKVLNDCLKLTYKVCQNFTIIVEELHRYMSKHKCLKWISQYVFVGASQGKGFWGISQRGQSLHDDFLTQTIHKICGKVSPEDEEYMEKKMGLKKHKCTIDELEKYEFWYLHFVAGGKPEKLKV